MKSFSQQDAINRMNHLGAQGEAFFFIISFLMDEIYIIPEKEVAQCPITFSLPGISTGTPGPLKQSGFRFESHPVSFSNYQSAFQKVQTGLREGNTYLINLTQPTGLTTDLSLDQIFALSDAPYKLLFHERFVVFSPETFVKINQGILSSFPMKGTIDAGIENAEHQILNDPKETAEHRTIVDLIRNDLGMVGSKVNVKKFRFIDRVETHKGALLQVSSEITAELPANYPSNIGALLFKLLPAGSVTGAPKKKTVALILEAEQYDRGFYTGIFGYFDGRNLDSAVMIRFIEQQADGTKIFKSGGGITAYSDPEKEYRELTDKVYVPFTGIH